MSWQKENVDIAGKDIAVNAEGINGAGGARCAPPAGMGMGMRCGQSAMVTVAVAGLSPLAVALTVSVPGVADALAMAVAAPLNSFI